MSMNSLQLKTWLDEIVEEKEVVLTSRTETLSVRVGKGEKWCDVIDREPKADTVWRRVFTRGHNIIISRKLPFVHQIGADGVIEYKREIFGFLVHDGEAITIGGGDLAAHLETDDERQQKHHERKRVYGDPSSVKPGGVSSPASVASEARRTLLQEEIDLIKTLCHIEAQMINMLYERSESLGSAMLVNTIYAFEDMLRETDGPFVRGSNIKYRFFVTELLSLIDEKHRFAATAKALIS